ncbi:MAG: arylformamidase [Thermoplasmata archaeon]|jgi:arylformamidase|nr:arylformamidase [Thermoplasmata archaeon]
MLLDVSQPVTPRTAAWPGDEPFSCGWSVETPQLRVGWARQSAHVGTHVDAPYHFLQDGARVGALPLDAFVGPALVVDARGRDALDASLLRGLDLARAPRVLFRTRDRADPEVFEKRYPVLAPDAIDALAAARVRLVGIDQASYDPWDAKDLVVHHALARAGIVNVENLRLDGVQPGGYELLAAPVNWADLDAAPLRALLRR